MRKLISVTVMGVLAMGLCIGFSGCSDETSTTKKEEIKTPGGTTTVTDKQSVKTSGDNPPPPKAP
jgi:hypothetical protein